MVLRCIPSMRGSGWLSASRILPCFLSREKQTVFDFCMLECSGSKEKRDHAHLCATTTKTWFWAQGFFFCFDHQYVIHYFCHCIHSVCVPTHWWTVDHLHRSNAKVCAGADECEGPYSGSCEKSLTGMCTWKTDRVFCLESFCIPWPAVSSSSTFYAPFNEILHV